MTYINESVKSVSVLCRVKLSFMLLSIVMPIWGGLGCSSDDVNASDGVGGRSDSGEQSSSEGGSKSCSELSVEDCTNANVGITEDDEEAGCTVVVVTQVEAVGEEYCLGSKHEYCVDVQGPNCGDSDAEAFWADSDTALYKTNDGCAPDHFERHETVRADESCPQQAGQ